MERGLFLVIEGSDGSGKSTQYKLLQERLKAAGLSVKQIKFPRYEEDASYFVRKYLSGEYGTATELGPYIPSLFYALDRYDNGAQIKQWLAEGYVVLADRYIAANKAHQGQKIDDPATRTAYYQWLDQLEFEMLGIPKPDLNLVLTVPHETAIELIKKRGDSQELDIHDADSEHLRRTTATYQELCALYPQTFAHIPCTRNNELLSIPTVNNLIWERIEPMLERLRKKKPDTEKQEAFAPQKTENPYIKKNENGSYSITKEGKAYLSEAITNTEQDVYAFTDKISAQTVAAAMARLSRRGDDMRVTILDEFTAKQGKDEDLLRRVITAYGDDSVQQLTGTHFVVENASNLLTKKLEWGRLAAYLEQSTRYIFFDQKDEHGKFKYYTPSTLKEEDAAHYNKQMDTLFEKYSQLVQKLTDYVRASSNEPEESRDGAWKAATRAQACDAARVLLPVATKSTVGVFASGQALESLIMHLQSDELAESRETGENLLIEARKVIPTFLERADKPDRGGAWVAYRAQTRASINELVHSKQLQPMKGNGDEAVQLTDFWPKNELDSIPHMLYEYSTLSLDELQKEVGEWSYSEKEAAVKTYIGERLNRRHKPGRALETVHYNFDLVCDYGIFRDLQRHRMVDAMEWQLLTPHYGYETPKLVTDAGFDTLFEECFDLSMKLYQYLLEGGYQYEAQYATLLGHRMRWKLMLNAREAYHFMEIRTSPQGHPGYRKLAKEMYDKIAEVHPLIASGMIFVNQGEDPELTRLASERATQFKLEQLK
jgi:thymidylate kinase/thymidylate synthase ThyX